MTEHLYYEDSFLREFEARVVDIEETLKADGLPPWRVALDRSAFYPESGGQPSDRGTLAAGVAGGAPLNVAVERVEEDESGVVWHYIRRPVAIGTEVKGAIDWARRLDHMQQHSGQHLLSAVFARELNALTVSFHLGAEESTIDLAINAISAEDLERVEKITNELIAEGRPVAIRSVERAEAEDLLSSGRLRKLPPRSGRIRLIEIADYDLNACGGTHVRSTGQIGGLAIRSTEKARHGLRVSFVCGLRAVSAARGDFTVLSRLATLLSAPAGALPVAVEHLNTRLKSSEKANQKLSDELAGYHASRLIVEEQCRDGLRVVCRRFDDRDPSYVRLLAGKVTAIAPRTVALMAAASISPARLLLGSSREMDCHCGNLIRETLSPYELRGGGSASMAQADIPLEKLDEVMKDLEARVRTRCATFD